MPKWKPGTEVSHKSGGPKMVVMATNDEGVSTCNWFDGGKPNTRDFHSNELIKHPPAVTRIELVPGVRKDDA